MIEPPRQLVPHFWGSRYLVLSSLPHLARFDRARRIPIGRESLSARLALLPACDADEIALAMSFLTWQRHPAGRSDAQVIAEYANVIAAARTAALRNLVEFRLDLRTLIAALRRRRRGELAFARGEWGVGRWRGAIKRRHSDPDFGLHAVLPWLPRARRMLDSGDAIGLEHLLFRLVWTELDRLATADRFGFDAVLAYVFKWDLVDRWLRHDASAASQRLEGLVRHTVGALGPPNAAAD